MSVDFLAPSSINEIEDRYYAGRWPYFAEAIRMIRSIPGAEQFTPSDVLEVGPYRLPIVRGCDVLDNENHGIPITHKHDAGAVPWPIETGRYRLMVALQVWEHLEGRQREAWQEARRVADWAVVSVPYLWPVSRIKDHENISRDTMAQWTGQSPILSTIVPTPASTRLRLVCLYDLKDKSY